MKPMRRSTACTAIVGAFLGVTGAATPAVAQLPGLTPGSVVRYTGEISSYGELYSVSGRESLRPSSLGRLHVRSSLELFGSIQVGLDMLLSTESGSGIGLVGADQRQRINQIGIRPEWSWGRAHLGSFADSWSDLTWSGVRVQGAGAAVNPGWLRLGAFGGRSRSAIPGGALDGAYQRTMWGGRVGLGRGDASRQAAFVDVIFLRVADDPTSLDEPGTVPAGPLTNPYAVTPQENVVLSVVNGLPLWSGRLYWRGEAAVSVHARDRRAPELTDEALDEYSGLLRSLVTPRSSTYGDVAWTGQLELRSYDLPGATATAPRTVSASVGYRHIGAGYVSLGLASLPADQRAANGNIAVRFRTWTATLQALRQNDNLLGQKIATTVRDRLAGQVTLRATRNLSSSVRASVLSIHSDAVDAGRRVDFSSVTFATSHMLSLGREVGLRAVSLNQTYQRSGDRNPARPGGTLHAHDADIRLTAAPWKNVTILPGIGLSLSRLDDGEWSLRHTYTLAGTLRGAGGRWSTAAALSNARLHAGGALRASLTGSYSVTPDDRINVSVRSNRVTGLQTAAGGFDEYTVSVGWMRSIQ